MKDWKACIRTWEQRQPKKIIPEWLNKEITNQELDQTDNEMFKDFLERFRDGNI